MIRALVKSAFQTGCFSVASEGLIHQVIERNICQLEDLLALKDLYAAVEAGQIQREASCHIASHELIAQG